MRKKSKDLQFISRIKSDGSGVELISEKENETLQNDKIDNEYELNSLSLLYKTFVASGFNSFVVKIK